MAEKSNQQEPLYTALDLSKVDEERAYFLADADSEERDIVVSRKRFPFLDEKAIGNTYEILVTEGYFYSGRKFEVIGLEELLGKDGKHGKDEAPEEVFADLRELSLIIKDPDHLVTDKERKEIEEEVKYNRDPKNWTSKKGIELRERMRREGKL